VSGKATNVKNNQGAPTIERLERLVSNPRLSLLLSPLGLVYGLLGRLRVFFYRSGLLAGFKASVPVVSVGNVTVGGTGKSPVVIDLADRLSSHGVSVSILSRGYGRKSKDQGLVVSRGQGPVVGVEASGDEPFIIARAVPAATVIVGSKRALSARMATENHRAQIIILDDGFQHIQLKRDIDIVLFDYNDEPDKLRLLPQGRLRESLSALRRASIVIITKIPGSGSHQGLSDAVRQKLDYLRRYILSLAPGAVLSYVSFAPGYLMTAASNDKNGGVFELNEIVGKKVFAVCGVARPEGFFASLHELGAIVVDTLKFSDHHWFDSQDLENIKMRFQKSGADYIVTTEKDLVRLSLPDSLGASTFALMIQPVWYDEQGAEISNPPFVESLLQLTKISERAVL